MKFVIQFQRQPRFKKHHSGSPVFNCCFFQSAIRKNDAAGAMLDDIAGELEELSPIEVCLPATGNAGEFVPVTLETVVTETGLLQLWSVARDGRRWKLEFNVRAVTEPQK